jgi:hypothetical protein
MGEASPIRPRDPAVLGLALLLGLFFLRVLGHVYVLLRAPAWLRHLTGRARATMPQWRVSC